MSKGKRDGQLYKKGQSWYVDIRDAKGHRIRRSMGKSKKHALRVLGNLRAEKAELSAIENPSPDEITVGQCWDYYKSCIESEGKASSVAAIKTARGRWASIEQKAVASLVQDDIKNAIDAMTVKTTSKNGSIKMLKAALNRAKFDRLLVSVPINLKERKYTKPRPLKVSKEGFRALLDKAWDHRTKTLLWLARYAGLRQQECLWLVVEDVDFDLGVIHVRSKPDYGWTVKNYEDRRVPMGGQLEQVLKTHISLLPSLKALACEHGVPQWMFPRRDCMLPVNRVTAWKWVSAAYKDAGIGGNRPGLHRLRKSWATEFLKHSNLGTLMTAGGWNSLATVRLYISTDEEAAREATDAMEGY
jgi:integrase